MTLSADDERGSLKVAWWSTIWALPTSSGLDFAL